MKTFICFLVCGWLACGAYAAEKKAELTKTGQLAPEFSVTTLGGKVLDLKQLRGKVVLLNFFATWCPPCMKEMPRLEKEIWQVYGANNKLVVVSVGREHDKADLQKFLKENPYTFALAPDPKRVVYSKFAATGIPRNYLIDGAGRIVFQSVGFSEEEFDTLKQTIKKTLSKPNPRAAAKPEVLK